MSTPKPTQNGNGNGHTPYTYPLLISNKPHLTKTTFPVHSPDTEALIHHFSSASIEDASLALNASHQAYKKWSRVPPPQKRDIFLRAADLFDSRKELLTQHMVAETGAAPAWAAFNLALAAEILRDVAGRVASIAGSIPQSAEPGRSALVYKEPYGTILAIAPWNAPFILGVRGIVYPLAAGNTVILKAPEFSPVCSSDIVGIMHEAGLPEGVLNLLAHRPEDAASVTKFLIESPIIKKINFTGSTKVGKIIAELAGKNLKPLLLELGGKAPAIVCDDADLELAAHECVVGAFLHSGQICMSTERVIVLESVVEKFEEEFKKAVKGFAGEGKPLPILINEEGPRRNKALIKDAVSKGAEVLCGDVEEGRKTKMGQVVVKGVKKGMDLYYTESFGPTVSLIVVKDEEEALELANDTEYGLSSAIFTKDLGKALRMAREIESGAVHINGMSVHDEAGLPHGGMKASGYGRFGSAGLDEWTRTKTVTFKE